MPRTQVSFSIDVLIDVAVASTAGLVNHASRVIPNPASTLGNRSRSPVICSVNSGASNRWVTAVAVSRAVATISSRLTTPGRTVRFAIRYSQARLNNVVGESCSIARPSRNSSNSFSATPPTGAVFHPR